MAPADCKRRKPFTWKLPKKPLAQKCRHKARDYYTDRQPTDRDLTEPGIVLFSWGVCGNTHDLVGAFFGQSSLCIYARL